MLYEIILVENENIKEIFKNFNSNIAQVSQKKSEFEFYQKFVYENFHQHIDDEKLKIFSDTSFYEFFTLNPFEKGKFDRTKFDEKESKIGLEFSEFESQIAQGVKSKEYKFKSDLGKIYAKFADDDSLKYLAYATHFISFFDGKILFAIRAISQENNTQNPLFLHTYVEAEFDEICKNNAKNCEIFERAKIKKDNKEYCNYKVAISSQCFGVYQYNSSQNRILDKNILKVLLIQTLCLAYKNIYQNFNNMLKNSLNLDNIYEILELKKSLFIQKLTTKFEVSEDRQEALKIFEKAKDKFNLDAILSVLSKDFDEFFNIKNEEYKIKNAKYQVEFQDYLKNLTTQQEKARIESEKRDKKMSKFVFLATIITILTCISVVADIFNLWDRFKPIPQPQSQIQTTVNSAKQTTHDFTKENR
ncbi:hypothetical protein [Campylobacter geochelonis]|uniref:Uncharacterized protein n=1 Tax=Campylobacter geochelonis TaxID=1780362 RepID=A0A128ECI2_9BACT|nr:hypothetical protein [Campylobacter geochelonis]QKF72115.1 hypothetical protein CGEO_1849 [Campylobacter geochelonis]CZE46704.1 Uncharacterised protein [Campylobacter geochelonis]